MLLKILRIKKLYIIKFNKFVKISERAFKHAVPIKYNIIFFIKSSCIVVKLKILKVDLF